MFDIVLVGEKLGHSSSTWISYNSTYLWCQLPHQFDFCSLIPFIKCVPTWQIWPTEGGGRRERWTKSPKRLKTWHSHTHSKLIWMRKFTYRLPIIHVDSNFEGHCETANGPLRFSMQLLTVLYRYTHVHTVVQCTCTNANMWTCFCLLHLCNRCRCDHIEDGTTESETFCSGSILISKMLNSNGRKENVISRAAEISFWSQ